MSLPRVFLYLLPALLALSACSHEQAVPPSTPLADVPFATATVSSTAAQRERVWDGVVEAVNQATLSAQTAGRVLELPFDVNDYVNAGEVVVRFTDVEQAAAQRQAEAALRAAEAGFAEADAEFRRIEEVYGRKLVSRAQFDQATARRAAAQAQLQATQAARKAAEEQLDYTVVKAPYSGIVTARHVEVGETVRPGQPLISGLSLNQLRLNVQIPQSDVTAIRQHGKAALLLPQGRRVEASKVTVFPYADPSTHSFSVRVELPEAETGLTPGMTVKVAFALGTESRMLIPASALLQRSEVSAVYVVGEAAVKLRQLRLGHRFEDQVEVLSGLSEGERIALDPLAALQFAADRRRGADHD
ncbi:efflux RND transporter periplasmic adaptor subunit [Pseudomarimonas arenosa]|uniref:Efflux RND transporter periplasmic adaptor subunit n=1 Tax=Pseudomarimonas arenosa TaxID=2774145 RepID=A0AAW3ZFD9_9GAMM|nr:efflux RND transporter periplasmic adaptor subunit [Pseudomarimonas arenosa]MBD8524868.1 efflux RND transporter periplasmic adaptor subunit [Pseudomarimonas arenosa]